MTTGWRRRRARRRHKEAKAEDTHRQREIASSGSDRHPVLRPAAANGVADDPGTLFHLDDEDLAAADAYEVDAYVRIEVPPRSVRRAWLYALDQALAN